MLETISSLPIRKDLTKLKIAQETELIIWKAYLGEPIPRTWNATKLKQ